MTRDSETCTIEQRGNCTLVFGSMPMTGIVKLLKAAPEDAVMSTHLAQLAGASLAAGSPADVERLCLELVPAALDRARGAYKDSGLHWSAVEWLAIGHRGNSSDAMFCKLTGVAPEGFNHQSRQAHPRDPSDFGNCRGLLDSVPFLAPKLPEMAAVSPVWARLVDAWDDLCASMDAESPMWRLGQGSAPVTYAKMQALLAEPVASSDMAP